MVGSETVGCSPRERSTSTEPRGAVIAADDDLGAPCFTGNDLVGMTVALRTNRPSWTNEDVGTIVGFAEMRPWVAEAMANPPAPVVAVNVVGVWSGVHPHWRHPVVLASDNTIHGVAAEDWGRWTFDGRTLTLNWNGYGPEPVNLQTDGSFASTTSTFTLRR